MNVERSSLGFQSCWSLGAPDHSTSCWLTHRSHAIAAVRSHRILRVDSAGDDSDVEVMLGAPVAVRTRAEGGGGHFVDVRPVRRLLH